MPDVQTNQTEHTAERSLEVEALFAAETAQLRHVVAEGRADSTVPTGHGVRGSGRQPLPRHRPGSRKGRRLGSADAAQSSGPHGRAPGTRPRIVLNGWEEQAKKNERRRSRIRNSLSVSNKPLGRLALTMAEMRLIVSSRIWRRQNPASRNQPRSRCSPTERTHYPLCWVREVEYPRASTHPDLPSRVLGATRHWSDESVQFPNFNISLTSGIMSVKISAEKDIGGK